MRLVTLTWPADGPRLQDLLERCSDYYELHEAWPTQPDTAEFEMSLRPGAPPDELLMLALEDDDGTLQGLVQLLRNYPKPGQWWIGLLVVAPEMRSRGIGAELLRQATEAAATAGATAILLGVSPKNPRGERFWEQAGFRQQGEPVKVTARSGHTDTMRILSRPI